MAPKEDDDEVSSVDVDEEGQVVEEDEEAMNDLNNADIVTKYRCAGDIASAVISSLIGLIKPGTRAVELCAQGDALVEEATAKVYNVKKGGKKVDKGSAFPTCVSVNNCCGHYSPLTSEDDVTLADGDVVKIDLGVHVDGYIGVVAHTQLCSADGAPATGRKADVMMAAWTASELAHRMFKEGAKNTEITDMIGKVCGELGIPSALRCASLPPSRCRHAWPGIAALRLSMGECWEHSRRCARTALLAPPRRCRLRRHTSARRLRVCCRIK
jgi:methionine aminopeptidase